MILVQEKLFCLDIYNLLVYLLGDVDRVIAIVWFVINSVHNYNLNHGAIKGNYLIGSRTLI